jgi:tetratricopeptide (TPR) repeat protein
MADDPDQLYRDGLRLHRAKDYEGAARLLERAVAADPAHADAWEALGILRDKLGRLDEAIAAMEKLAALRPGGIMAHPNLTRLYMKKGLKERAEEEQGKARLLGWKQELAQGGAKESELAQAAPAGEASAPAIVSMLGSARPLPPATAAQAVRDAGDAPPLAADSAALTRKIAQFENLVAHNSKDALSRFTLGRAYLEAGRADEALRVLEELLALEPEHTAAHVQLGRACEAAGKLARAIKTYTRGIELAQRKGDLHPRNQMQERLAALTGPAPKS